jgi:hypothetical protein
MFALTVVILSALAGATTVADYEKMPAQSRIELLTSFIDKMTTDIREKDPQLAQNSRSWFIDKQEGNRYRPAWKPLSWN